MTKEHAYQIVVMLLNRLTLNPAEAAGVNAALLVLQPEPAPKEPKP
jgi:hypothetical protein